MKQEIGRETELYIPPRVKIPKMANENEYTLQEIEQWEEYMEDLKDRANVGPSDSKEKEITFFSLVIKGKYDYVADAGVFRKRANVSA